MYKVSFSLLLHGHNYIIAFRFHAAYSLQINIYKIFFGAYVCACVRFACTHMIMSVPHTYQSEVKNQMLFADVNSSSTVKPFSPYLKQVRNFSEWELQD